MTGSERALIPLPCFCATMRRACRAFTQLYDSELQTTGLRVSQFTLLLELTSSGETTRARLAKLLLLDSTTLTRTLGRLSKRGWIARSAGKDNREHYWKLTEAGKQQLAGAMPHWERAQGRLTAALETVGDSMRQVDALAETAIAVRRRQG